MAPGPPLNFKVRLFSGGGGPLEFLFPYLLKASERNASQVSPPPIDTTTAAEPWTRAALGETIAAPRSCQPWRPGRRSLPRAVVPLCSGGGAAAGLPNSRRLRPALHRGCSGSLTPGRRAGLVRLRRDGSTVGPVPRERTGAPDPPGRNAAAAAPPSPAGRFPADPSAWARLPPRHLQHHWGCVVDRSSLSRCSA